ncbi:differentially expressed in B16F10 1, isoform CRA_b [Mus musculus]|nr:differentially expressed in B16F10 1, isoform CRA_b [Mus musculus]
MSVIFAPDWLRGKAKVNQETIQRVSDREPEIWCRSFLQGPDRGGDSLWAGEGMGAGSARRLPRTSS